MTTHATRPLTSAPALPDAAALATSAAARAGVEVRLLDTNDDMRDAAEILAVIWGTAPGAYPVNADLLRALQHSGAYVSGVYVDSTMIGASLAFLAGIEKRFLHSHITGLIADGRNRGVGYAVKLHQRAWAIERGIDTISWTFDPMQRRNCHFNVSKLGARVTEYHQDFYGMMRDSINKGDHSDRLYAEWELLSPRVLRALSGGCAEIDPPQSEDEIMLGIDERGAPRLSMTGTRVFVPSEFSALRQDDPELGLKWRLAVREAFARQTAAGREIAAATTDGWYVFEEVSA